MIISACSGVLRFGQRYATPSLLRVRPAAQIANMRCDTYHSWRLPQAAWTDTVDLMETQVATPIWQQIFHFAWDPLLYPLTALLALITLLLFRLRENDQRILINTFGFYLVSGSGLL